MKRVVITGQGTINALGNNVAETLGAFREGRSGIGPLDFRDVERLSVRIGGQVRDFRQEEHFGRKEITLYDRYTQFALLAAEEAVAQSGLTFDSELGETSGVVLGTAGGGLHTQEENFRLVFEEKKNRVPPFVVPRLMSNAAASHVSMKFGLKGPVFTISTACASSNHAMGEAFRLVQHGTCPVVLSGGSESMLCFGGIKAWEGLRVCSPDACRPFSRTRNGMVQGEGAAVFVFEEYEHARQRGADILAEIVGFSMSSDASDIVAPSTEGAVRAMRGVLRDSGLDTSDIGYINAHGTGTVLNDRSECLAIKEVFGSDVGNLLVSSTKSMHGHLVGATGAVEFLACIMALRESVIAPTIGFEEPDPDCDLDVVPNTAREAKVSAVLSNAFAFGGLNAILALKAV